MLKTTRSLLVPKRTKDFPSLRLHKMESRRTLTNLHLLRMVKSQTLRVQAKLLSSLLKRRKSLLRNKNLPKRRRQKNPRRLLRKICLKMRKRDLRTSIRLIGMSSDQKVKMKKTSKKKITSPKEKITSLTEKITTPKEKITSPKENKKKKRNNALPAERKVALPAERPHLLLVVMETESSSECHPSNNQPSPAEKVVGTLMITKLMHFDAIYG
jgi:hypothetical protein